MRARFASSSEHSTATGGHQGRACSKSEQGPQLRVSIGPDRESADPFWQRLAESVGCLRLRGPLSDDINAQVLHGLLLGLLAWTALYGVIILPFIAPKPFGSAVLL